MTTQQHPALFDWATELLDAEGRVTLSAKEAHEIGARLRSMGDKLKAYEDLDEAASDVQLLRMGYAAARLEIESLRALSVAPAGEYPPLPEPVGKVEVSTTLENSGLRRHKASPAYTSDQRRAYVDRAMRVAQPAYKDSTPELHVGDSAFENWYSTYNPAHKADKQRARDAYAAGMGDPLVTAVPAAVAGPSQETCQTCQGNGEVTTDWERYKHPLPGDVGDEAVAECQDCDGQGTVDAAPTTQPAPPQEPVYAFRRKGLDDFCTCTEKRYAELSAKPNLFETRIFYTAPQPLPASQGDALDTARLDWLDKNIFYRDMPEWDAKHGHGSGYNMWVLFAPKGAQGSARSIIDAASTAQEGK